MLVQCASLNWQLGKMPLNVSAFRVKKKLVRKSEINAAQYSKENMNLYAGCCIWNFRAKCFPMKISIIHNKQAVGAGAQLSVEASLLVWLLNQLHLPKSECRFAVHESKCLTKLSMHYLFREVKWPVSIYINQSLI